MKTSRSVKKFFHAHRTLFLSIGFLVLFSITITYATPPTSPYAANETLDPSCGPTDTNCYVAATGGASVWGSITGTPTTLGGYGITDAYTKTASDARYQTPITLTTTGTSGAATFTSGTLNIPQYAGATYAAGTGLTLTGSTFSVNASQNISTISNLTSNGLIKTSGGTGALSIATAGTDYLAPTGSGASLTGITTAQVGEGTNLYFTNARAIAVPLTGYVSGAGTVSSSDTVLQAIQKINGNVALTVPYTGATSDVALGSHNFSANQGTFSGLSQFGLGSLANAAAAVNIAKDITSFTGDTPVLNIGSVSALGDDTTLQGDDGLIINLKDNPSVTPSTANNLFGIQIILKPEATRSKSGIDDVTGITINNVTDNGTAGADGYYLGSEYVGTGTTTQEWSGGSFKTDANSAQAFGASGHYNNGLDFVNFGSRIATFTGSAIVIPNASKISFRNNANTTNIQMLNTDSSDNILLGSTSPIKINTGTGAVSIGNLTSNGLLKTSGGTGALSIATAGTDYENPLTFSTGLTRSTNTITDNLAVGVSGGQSVKGGTGTTDVLSLIATTGNGTVTNAGIQFKVGNNGGTTSTTILNSGFFGIGTTAPSGLFTLAGNQTANAWGTAGINFQTQAATYTDSNSASGTVASNMVNTFGTPTLAASNTGVIYTNAATVYINNAPTAGTNVTITNGFALAVNSGLSAFNGGISSSLVNGSSSNLQVAGGVNIAATGNAAVLFGGASTIEYRTVLTGNVTQTLIAGASESNVIIGSQLLTTPATGTNAMLANLVVNPIGTVASGGATVTNTASLYIGGASSAGTNNYALDVASGLSQFGSSSVTTGTTVATFQNAGGTCNIVPSTSGGVSCSSDMNLKKNITLLSDGSTWTFNNDIVPDGDSILGKVLTLQPVDYNWNVESDTDPKHAGFIAQEVQQVFPDLVSQDPTTHLLSLNYTGLVPYTVEAVKEMNLNITDIADLTRPNNWRDALLAWFGDVNNGIDSFFSKKISSEQDTTNELDTQKLCVGTVCVTQQQFLQMIQNSGQTSTISSTLPPTDPSSTQSSDSTPNPSVSDPVPTNNESPEVSTPVITIPTSVPSVPTDTNDSSSTSVSDPTPPVTIDTDTQ